MCIVTHMEAGHLFQIIDGLGKTIFQMFRVTEKFGREDDKVRHWITILRQFKKHPSLMADLIIGKDPVRKRGDQLIIVRHRVRLYIIDNSIAEISTMHGQLSSLFRSGCTFALCNQQAQKLLLLAVARFKQKIHIVPTRRQLMLRVVAIVRINHRARLIAFKCVARIVNITVKHIRSL